MDVFFQPPSAVLKRLDHGCGVGMMRDDVELIERRNPGLLSRLAGARCTLSLRREMEEARLRRCETRRRNRGPERE